MPSRASIETVNAVSNGDSFLAAIRSRPSSSQRSGVSARQISPRAWVAMKLIASGRGELGGEREVALVLAVLGVADHHHLARADVLDGLLDRAEGRVAHTCAPARASPRTWRSRPPPGSPGAPARAEPSVVRSRVSGMSETLKPPSSTSATVSDTPSTATEPFSTT